MRFLLRVLVSAAALGVATWVVSGITLPAASGWSKAGTLLVVALIFGIINATRSPRLRPSSPSSQAAKCALSASTSP